MRSELSEDNSEARSIQDLCEANRAKRRLKQDTQSKETINNKYIRRTE